MESPSTAELQAVDSALSEASESPHLLEAEVVRSAGAYSHRMVLKIGEHMILHFPHQLNSYTPACIPPSPDQLFAQNYSPHFLPFSSTSPALPE